MYDRMLAVSRFVYLGLDINRITACAEKVGCAIG
jgi:hypothetical protein